MLSKLIKIIVDFRRRDIVRLSSLLAFLGFLDYLFKWKVLGFLYNIIAPPIQRVLSQLQREIASSPASSLLVAVLLLILAVFYFRLRKRLNIVAGEFRDDFASGLHRWEFGGEGWKIEKEDEKFMLSVSESPDGGITKRGFSWSDYEFNFDTKIINKNVGWIVRAESRNKYLMVQLNLEEPESPRLRFHLRLPQSSRRKSEWIVTQVNKLEPEKPISPHDWINVRIVVLGSNIDVYLNNEHSVHYFVADPIRWEEKFDWGITGAPEPEIGSYVATINYGAGKVGFRCSSGEHAHFRNVRVKPL